MATAVERFAARLIKLENRVNGLATGPQLGHSSLENGSLEEYDENGQLVTIIGKQPDGTHGAVVVSGPNPPRPSPAVVSGGPGLLNYGWDGNFADEATGKTDATVPAPMDFARVEAHASKFQGFSADTAATLLDTFESPRGGTRTAMLEPGTWFVVLVSRALSGKRSIQSQEVSIEVLAPVGSDIDVDALREEFRAVDEEMNAAILENKKAQATLAGTVTTLRDTTLPALDQGLASAEERLASAQAAIDTAIPSQITAAKQAAITAAAADATAKKEQAEAAAALDAKAKADKALADAKADATSKADSAKTAAVTAAAADAKAQAEAAEARAAETAALDAKTKADAAQAAALAAAKTYADAQASGAGGAALEAARADAQAKAEAAKTAAIAAASADATAKREQAEATAAADAKAKADKALADAKVDAKSKADAAQSAAITAAAADATAKKEQAEANAAADAKAKADKALADAKADATSKANAAQSAAISAAASDAQAKADAARDSAAFLAITAQAYSLNPSFDDWAGAAPAGYAAYGTGPTKETALVRRGSTAARFDCTDTTTGRGLNLGSGVLRHAPDLEYWTVELSFYLVSGSSLSGAGVRLDFNGYTIPPGTQPTLALAGEIPNPVAGKWYTVTKTLRRPAGATGNLTSLAGYLFANYSSAALGPLSVKDIIFDWANIRPATNEEITSYGAPALIDAKSDALIQSNTPASTYQKSTTLWIDTTGGANTPKRWSGSAWVEITDRAAKDAAAAAKAAQDAADKAQAAAGTAGENAIAALTMAGSKSRVYYSTSVATGTATGDGDLWRQRDASNNVVAEWRWNGTPPAGSWVKTAISSSAIANLDIGKLTVGSAAILDVVAQSIAASTAAFQTVDIGNLFVTGNSALNTITSQRIASNIGEFLKVSTDQLIAGNASLGTAVADKFFAEVVAGRKFYAEQIIVGQPGNLIPDPGFNDAGFTAKRNAASTCTVSTNTSNDLILANYSTGLQYLRPLGSVQNQAAALSNEWLAVKPGDTYRFTFDAFGWKGTTGWAQLVGRSMDGATVYNIGRTPIPLGNNSVLVEVTIPDNVFWMVPEVAVPPGGESGIRRNSMGLTQVITPALIVDGLMNGKRIVGASIETNAESQRGLKFIDSGLHAWDSSGALTFRLDASTGGVYASGTFESSAGGVTARLGTQIQEQGVNRPILDFINSAGASLAKIFAEGPGGVEEGSSFGEGSLVLASREKTLNSSGRSQIVLFAEGSGGRMSSAFGPNNGTGFHWSGDTAWVNGRLMGASGALAQFRTGSGSRGVIAQGSYVEWTVTHTAPPPTGFVRPTISVDYDASRPLSFGVNSVTRTGFKVRAHNPGPGSIDASFTWIGVWTA